MGKEIGHNKTAFSIKEMKKYKMLSLILIVLVINIQLLKNQNIESIFVEKVNPIEKNKNSQYDLNSISDLMINQITMKSSQAIRLSDNDGHASFLPNIATDSSGNVHIVWHDESTPNDEIFYRKYFNKNGSWSDIELLSNASDSRNSIYPVIKIDANDVIHVLWRENGFLVPSTLNYCYFNGTNWSDIEIVSEIIDVTVAHDLVSYNNTTFIIWNNESSIGPYELFYRLYHSNNESWSVTVQLTNSTYASISPSVILNSKQELLIVWVDRSPIVSVSEIHYLCLNNSWLIPEALIVSTIDEIRSARPSISVAEDDLVHIVWEDSKDLLSEIHYRSIDSSGLGGEKLISDENQTALYPASDCDNFGNVHIVWNENEYICYKQVNPNGISSEPLKLTNNQSILIFPKISVFENVLHIIWNDYLRDNSWEVYYFRGKLLHGNRLLLAVLIPISIILFGGFVFITLFIIRKKKHEKRISV